jgi:hypothetical protein
VTDKWLDVQAYLDPEVITAEVELLNAQAADAEQRVWGIHSIGLASVFRGAATQLIMTVNTGLQSEERFELCPEQMARLVPAMVFEAREAIQRSTAAQSQLAEADRDRWGLHRCPECGVGPYGSYARGLSGVAQILAASSLEAMYGAYDRVIAPVMEKLPDATRQFVCEVLEYRRSQLLARRTENDQG